MPFINVLMFLGQLDSAPYKPFVVASCLTVSCIALFLLNYYSARAGRRLARAIQDAPLRNVTELSEGLQKLNVSLRAAHDGEELVSPIRRIRCVYYSVFATKEVPHNEGTRTQKVFSDVQEVNCVLFDKTGEFSFDLRSFDAVGCDNEHWSQSLLASKRTKSMIANFEEFSGKNGRGLTVYESALPTQEEYFAFGRFLLRNGILYVSRSSVSSLLTVQSEASVIEELRSRNTRAALIQNLSIFVFASQLGFVGGVIRGYLCIAVALGVSLLLFLWFRVK